MENLKLDIGKLDFEKVGGLIPAIIQDIESGAALMLEYQNREAIEKSLESKKVT